MPLFWLLGYNLFFFNFSYHWFLFTSWIFHSYCLANFSHNITHLLLCLSTLFYYNYTWNHVVFILLIFHSLSSCLVSFFLFFISHFLPFFLPSFLHFSFSSLLYYFFLAFFFFSFLLPYIIFKYPFLRQLNFDFMEQLRVR